MINMVLPKFSSYLYYIYDRGPVRLTTVPGTHVPPAWMLWTITLWPRNSSWCFAWVSCRTFWSVCFSITLSTTLGGRKSSLVLTCLPKNKEHGATLVVECGILWYDKRKLFNRWLNEAFDLSLIFMALLKTHTKHSAAPLDDGWMALNIRVSLHCSLGNYKIPQTWTVAHCQRRVALGVHMLQTVSSVPE